MGMCDDLVQIQTELILEEELRRAIGDELVRRGAVRIMILDADNELIELIIKPGAALYPACSGMRKGRAYIVGEWGLRPLIIQRV